MNSPPGPYSVNRLIEWSYASFFVANALLTAITYGEKQSGAFYMMSQMGIGDGLVIVSFLIIGVGRYIALYLNGRWRPYGAWMRMAGSLSGAMVWGILLLALVWIYATQGILYRGAMALYFCATIFEILSCHRAANDSRIGSIT